MSLLTTTVLAISLLAPPASEADRLNAARIAFEADDFATAARGFESLSHDFPATAKYRYYAGLARENAGQDSHAYFNMRMFLASGAGTPEDQKLAAERAAAISRRTTRVRIQLPANDLPVILIIKYLGPKSQATRPVITIPLVALPLADSRPELALEPGQWELSVTPSTIHDEQIQPTIIEVTAGEPTATLRLTTKKIPEFFVHLGLERTTRLRKKITVELRREGSTAPPILHTTSAAAIDTTLPPGKWIYKASGQGLKTIEGTFTLDRSLQQNLKFTSDIDDAERQRRKRLGLGLMGTGLVTAAAGTSLLIAGVVLQDRLLPLRPTESDRPPTDHVALSLTGLGLLGGTTGLWTAAATSPIRTPRGWIPGMTLGVLMSGIGAACFILTHDNIPDLIPKMGEPPPMAISDFPEVLASSFILGLGAGLLSGSAAGYLSTRKVKRSTARATLNIIPTPRSSSIAFRFTF